MVKILAALVSALSILNSSGASPGATEKVAALVARATCSGASHSSAGKLPSTLMRVVIIPLLKCKYKDPADVNNYRPIAIATALSKVLEQVKLSRLARCLWTADSQFGFKQAHGTEMAIFALKQTIDLYRNQDTPVYMFFLDAKMVFDRVNHRTLAKKLRNRNVPLHIVKLFIFWYREQEFMVRYQ